MIIDNVFNFSSAQVLGTGTSDVNSTNVYDAGSAVFLFGGNSSMKISIDISSITSGSSDATFRARLVGSAAAALTSPIIIDDTGVSLTEVAGDAPKHLELIGQNQQAAYRYYGIIYTQGGTSPNHTVSANGVIDAQTNLIHNNQ